MSRFKRMSGMTMAVLELLKIGLAMAGLFLIMVHGSRAYEAYNSQFWPTTMGEVTRSAVDASGDFDGNRRYHSRIKYAYEVDAVVDGQPENDYFIGTRFSIDPIPPADSRALADAKLDPYPKGALVEIYYNPTRPQRSMLEPNFSFAYLMMPAVGLLCLGAAIGLWKIGREAI